jgi:hypothetical protein
VRNNGDPLQGRAAQGQNAPVDQHALPADDKFGLKAPRITLLIFKEPNLANVSLPPSSTHLQRDIEEI